MYAWEESFSQNIRQLRKNEIKKNIIYQIALLFNRSIEVSFSFFGGLLMFYIAYYYYGNRYSLDIGTVYSTIDLLLILKIDVIFNIGQGIQSLFQLQIAFQRMLSVIIKSSSMNCVSGQNRIHNSELEVGCIEYQNFFAFWKENTYVLQDINLSIKKGELISIVGRVGSGKTSLLNCLLEEIPYFKGNFCFNGKLAYVEQEPYIFNCSIKENIIFGKEFDEELYQRVIQTCCLKYDIDEFDLGDETQIGERGINISGGQKARISLARAIYSQADIYLFDDPLSAVDSKVAKNIFFNAIKTVCQGSTVLLVTHQIHYTEFTDKTLILEDGKIKNYGTYSDLKEDLKILKLDQQTIQKRDANQQKKENIDDQQIIDGKLKQIQSMFSIITKLLYKIGNMYDDLIQDSSTNILTTQNLNTFQNIRLPTISNLNKIQNTNVTFETYKFFYNMSSIPWLLIFILGMFALSEILFVVFNKQLGNIQSTKKETLFIVLWWILLGYFLTQILKFIVLILYINNCSYNIHQRMMHSLFRATVPFYNLTTSGDILNLFSTDIGLIDGGLLIIIVDVLEFIMQLICFFVAVAFITPYFYIVGLVEFLIIFSFVMTTKHALFYTKQLDLKLKAPIFSSFNVALSGVLSIRVYKQQQYFEKKFDVLGNNSLRATWYFYLSSRGFATYINLFALILNAIGIFLVISIIKSGPLIGQSIIFLVLGSELQQWGIRQFTIKLFTQTLFNFLSQISYQIINRQLISADVTMSSTQRCKNLVEQKSEPEQVTQYDEQKFGVLKQSSKQKLKQQEYFNNEYEKFPSKGEVIFRNVQMRYHDDLSLVLKGVSFSVQPGKRVGLVGRTGAGKSSIIQALFRMIEIEPDFDMILNEEQNLIDDDKNQIQIDFNQSSGIFIDGHNIKDLGLHTLRRGIGIIPQVPFVFSGTVRSNIDPLNEFSDEQIEDVLADIQLLDKVNSLDDKLYTQMSSSEQIFSAGERQLICLGRAILRRSPLIVLDEATANCDIITDELIQQKLRQRFENSTIITIAHRLRTIADYDQVIVLDSGYIIEQGSPFELLNNQYGYFYQMVAKTGIKNLNTISKIAEEKFKQNQ